MIHPLTLLAVGTCAVVIGEKIAVHFGKKRGVAAVLEMNRRKRKERRRNTIVATAVLCITGITAAWFYVASTPIL